MQKGDVIAGRFELLAHAGTGGMASVYRAHDRVTSQTIAIKVLAIKQPADVTRFTREATVLSTIHHPNIVDYIAHGQVNDTYFLAQEWVEGETLSGRLRGSGITARDAVVVAAGVANALAAIHALGVIHRDVKPSNIILVGGDPGRIKLVDFGIARPASEAGVLTRTGDMLGTPSYMAPEQARGFVTIDAAADVWALGCVLYQALTGRVAFSGKTAAAIRAKVLLSQPTPVAAACPEAPAELLTLIDDMLHKDPLARPRDGAAVATWLATLPAIPDGATRTTGRSEPPTVVLSTRPSRSDADTTNSFVFFTPADDEPDLNRTERVAQIADNHEMAIHCFEDGSALLVARKVGKPGAVAAARAALELSRLDGAISVFGRAANDSIDSAVDRGSMLLDRAMMRTLFGDVGDNGDDGDLNVVHIDDVIEKLIDGEIPVAKTDKGPVLRAAPRAQSSSG